MNGDKLAVCVAGCGAVTHWLPAIEDLNNYLTLTLSVLSIGYLVYKMIRDFRGGNKG